MFSLIAYGFNMVSSYLGGWATTFLATMLFLVMFRIGFAFVLKIFRMNLDYRSTNSKIDFYKKHEKFQK